MLVEARCPASVQCYMDQYFKLWKLWKSGRGALPLPPLGGRERHASAVAGGLPRHEAPPQAAGCCKIASPGEA